MIPAPNPFVIPRLLLKFLAHTLSPCRYLEIGLQDAATFREVIPYCQTAWGVELESPRRYIYELTKKVKIFRGTSDEFFEKKPAQPMEFDLVFIDGGHSYEQAKRDLDHSLQCLSPKGLIVMHDTMPPDVQHTNLEACGDVFRLADQLGSADSGIRLVTIPCIFGLTLLTPRRRHAPPGAVHDPT